MSSVAVWYGNWQFWQDYPDQKVVFDGPNKTIYVAAEVTELDVKVDLYSAWKEWIVSSQEYPHPLAYLPAFTAVGGDPITNTTNLGVTYFLENGWRIQPAPSDTNYVLTVTGNIYTREAGGNPFLFAAGVSVSLVRSNIVEQVNVGGGSGASAAEIASAVWTSLSRTLTSGAAPTVVQIRQEMDANSTRLADIQAQTDIISVAPSANDIADAVRVELTPELTHLMTLENNPGLTNTQATMLLEMYELLGLDPTKPLVVTEHARTAGTISQNIATSSTQTVVTRV
jgi:hypothetical protein